MLTYRVSSVLLHRLRGTIVVDRYYLADPALVA
jgi:hypothetical protein